MDPDTAYTMHIVHTGLRSVALDRLTGNDQYVVHLWPAAADVQGSEARPTVLRRFDPFCSTDALPYFKMPVALEEATNEEEEEEEEEECVFKGSFHVNVNSFMLFLSDAGSEVDMAKVCSPCTYCIRVPISHKGPTRVPCSPCARWSLSRCGSATASTTA